MGTTAQQFFSFFYAALLGAMLSGVTGLRAFPWGFMGISSVEGSTTVTDHRLTLARRLVTAVLLLNILPMILFAQIFVWVGCLGQATPSFWIVLLVSLCSLSAFAPYRIFHWLMLVAQGSELELYSRAEFQEITRNRSTRPTSWPQLLAAAAYLLPVGVLYLQLPN